MWEPVMPREDAAKARRLLAEGRITLRELSDDRIRAEVRGDSARLYLVEWTAGHAPAMPCPIALPRPGHPA
jgi:hypothetical protein